MLDVYDLVIIGAGPAGLTAGICSGLVGLKTLVLEGGVLGGQTVNIELIKDYPGFPDGVSGAELSASMLTQAMNLGVEMEMGKVNSIELAGESKVVKTESGIYTGRALIIAGGGQPKKLGVPSEDVFSGRGVSYCASCDAGFFRGLPVAIVGSDNINVTANEAQHLAKYVSKVTVIHSCKRPRLDRILQKSDPKIEFLWDTAIREIEGESSVNRLKIYHTATGKESTLDLSGVFIYAGISPDTDYLKGVLPLDNTGHIIVNAEMETGIRGIWAAGDIRHGSPERVATAVGDGATAAISAIKFIEQIA